MVSPAGSTPSTREERWSLTNAADCGREREVTRRVPGVLGVHRPHSEAPSGTAVALPAQTALCRPLWAGGLGSLGPHPPLPGCGECGRAVLSATRHVHPVSQATEPFGRTGLHLVRPAPPSTLRNNTLSVRGPGRPLRVTGGLTRNTFCPCILRLPGRIAVHERDLGADHVQPSHSTEARTEAPPSEAAGPG